MSKYYIQTNNHIMALSQLQFFVFNDFYIIIIIIIIFCAQANYILQIANDMLPFMQMIVVADIDFSLIDSEREKMPIAKVRSKSNFLKKKKKKKRAMVNKQSLKIYN